MENYIHQIDKVIVSEEDIQHIIEKVFENLRLLPEEQRTLPVIEYILERCAEESRCKVLLL